MQPWDQQPGEPPAAYEAFGLYLRLGSGRSIAKVGKAASGPQKAAKGPQRAAGNLNRWCKRFRWVGRAAAYDVHLANAAARAHEDAARKSAEDQARRWSERRDRYLETRWLPHDLASQKLNEITKRQRAADQANDPKVKPPTPAEVRDVTTLLDQTAAGAREALAIVFPATGPVVGGPVAMDDDILAAGMIAMSEAKRAKEQRP